MGTFRNTVSFGKRIEFWIIGEMLKEGLDVYIPLVDDMGIDAIVRKENGSFLEVQIKAKSKNPKQPGNAGLFAPIKHDEIRENYFFIFYSEMMDTTWIMSSAEFLKECTTNKEGKTKGKRNIRLHGTKKEGKKLRSQLEAYIASDFSRLK